MAFTQVLIENDIKISTDGKGAWRDNVFVELVWKSVKYEEVYLRAYASVPEARSSLGRYLNFYNTKRPHSSLDRQTPDRAYLHQLLPILSSSITGQKSTYLSPVNCSDKPSLRVSLNAGQLFR